MEVYFFPLKLTVSEQSGLVISFPTFSRSYTLTFSTTLAPDDL